MMKKGNILKKVLAVSGTVLVFLPLLSTVATAVIHSLSVGRFQLDYLMPAELFFVVFIGALLLLWAALWARLYRPHIVIGTCCAVALFFGMQIIASASGLATGETAPDGWAWYAVLATLALYVVAIVWLGIAGILLSKRLYALKPAEA